MNKQITNYNRLSLTGLFVFLLLIVIQIFWLNRALTLDQAEHQLTLKQLVPEIALEINALNHDAFHSKDEMLNNISLDSIEQIIQKYLKQKDIDGTIAFSIFQKGKNGLFRSNAPQLKRELKTSKIRACMSCIISFSVITKPVKKVGESEESFEERIKNKEEVFQYFRPVKNLTTRTNETLYFSIHHKKGILQSIGTIWYLFLGGILLNIILLLLFHYLIKSLANYKQVTQVKDDFFSNMTHEFKTPLSSIRLAGRMLKSNPNVANKHTYLELIEKESMYLENQIDQLLEFSLLDQNGPKINKTLLSFSDLFDDVHKRMSPVIEAKEAIISFSVEANETVYGSHTHLCNCFCNMIENSIKHSDKGVSICIYVSYLNGKRCISVRDDGPGIATKHRDKIFHRFYRVSNENQYRNKGFGIGLCYVKSVVEMHDGTIELNITSQTGTEFLIFI